MPGPAQDRMCARADCPRLGQPTSAGRCPHCRYVTVPFDAAEAARLGAVTGYVAAAGPARTPPLPLQMPLGLLIGALGILGWLVCGANRSVLGGPGLGKAAYIALSTLSGTLVLFGVLLLMIGALRYVRDPGAT